MGRMVLLEHTTADGAVHYDWLLERESNEERRLVSFRVVERIDLPGAARWRAERIDDHREAYLTFEGEVGGNRGRVRRLAAGTCEIVQEASDRLRLRIDWGRGGFVAVGGGVGQTWTFSRA